MVRVRMVIVVPHIRYWTLVPWIKTYPNGVEFTWLFLAVARYAYIVPEVG